MALVTAGEAASRQRRRRTCEHFAAAAVAAASVHRAQVEGGPLGRTPDWEHCACCLRMASAAQVEHRVALNEHIRHVWSLAQV
jgi:hypothetical protein